MNDSTSAPLSDDPVFMAFLKDLAAAAEPARVVDDYARRYPDRQADFRAVAELRRNLERPAASEDGDEPVPGRLGDFRIIRELARGGMGTIFEAVQEPLGRKVAVKTVLGRRFHLAESARERFLREQTVLAQLHHTHIVPIHAAGTDGTLQYFAMSYIDGAALNHVVRTARLHESSTHRGRERTTTLTLAALAAQARSSMDAGNAGGRHDESANGHLRRPAESTTVAMPDLGPAQPGVLHGPEPRPDNLANGNGKLYLSPGYFRSVARVMLDAAEAVQHAHEAGIIHRDLKPSNLMVDTAEHCWLLDFGLAGFLRDEANGGTSERDARDVVSAHDRPSEQQLPLVSGVLGTPDYMAPEQFHRMADARTDIWGLGVTLYELLTLHRPFHSQKQIESEDPARPSMLVHALPRDLEAICWKAIRKDPGQRYQSARDFADDVRRWTRGEPVGARPAHTLRRVGMWARRNKGWAAALAVATLAIVSGSLGAAWVSNFRAGFFQRAASASQREAQTLRGVMLQQMQRIKLTHLRDGWSKAAWSLGQRAAEEAKPGDPRIQAQIATCLGGIDAGKVKSLPRAGTGLAFEPSGKRLMISGSSVFGRGPDEPIHVWDGTTDQVQPYAIDGDGVFGFHRDGAALFLTVPRGDLSIANLWDVATTRVLRAFKSPAEGNSKISSVAITPDASLVAAFAAGRDARGETVKAGVLAVWEAASGREVLRVPCEGVTQIALSPDASLVAAGHDGGEISVRSLPKGELAATLKADRNAITSLAFGRDPVRRIGQALADSRPLLATGDAGGAVMIWDLRLRIPRSICQGSAGSMEIRTLAFGPDGMTLASAGRGYAKLWDIASGQHLLDVWGGDYVTAVAFSADGKRLAVGSAAAFGGHDRVEVWDLEPGRGIQSLRGLQRSVFWSTFSPDGRLVAALSEDWRVGIWDRAAHRLLHVLEVTPGSLPDNAALALSADGRRFAFSSGKEASLWDVSTGETLKTWKLFLGLQDRLAFSDSNSLLLYRLETETGEFGPVYRVDPVKHPRVCRIRNLLGADPLKPIAEIRDCNLHVFGSECSVDGRYYVIEGLAGSDKDRKRLAALYDGRTGKKLGLLPTESPVGWPNAQLNFDPPGTVLNFGYSGERSEAVFLELPSRTPMRHLDAWPRCLGPNAKRWLTITDAPTDQPTYLTLHEQGRREPFLNIMSDSLWTLGIPRFSPAGSHLVWGDSSGVVTVVDLVEVNRRLSEIGLGW
jgi:serine/threonine protein kinase/WD40 repeat protein